MMNKREVYICVDAGGTTSKAAIFSKDGTILARGFAESGSPAVTYDRWYVNIEKSMIDAINHYQTPMKIPTPQKPICHCSSFSLSIH